ncbi:hypothetical protein BS329_02150 [Amycolatopsis coloradensis]|uniref:DUF8017 domain-containing protein n=1 Tax=Amycolatopsis coloradensis TaxID=76021 RepID=A0A1R0L269_9PSEU|nr:hypothetical protein [Amycolatopsis coloradensis]OLZ56457.1 hypothetical protein BS329_02150 [Amycolatopsis coloradensis]
MGLFGKKRGDSPGYEDNAALDGFGGYQPSDSPGSPPAPEPAPAAEPTSEPQQPAKQPMSRSGRRAMYGFFATLGVIAIATLANTSDNSSESSAPTSRKPSVYTPSPQVVSPPSIEGWQSVTGGDGTYAYDVPPGWTPKPGTVHGWEKSAAVPGSTMTTSAFFGDGFCPQERTSRLAGSGVRSEKTADPAAAALKAASDLALSAYSPDEGPLATFTVSPAQKTEIPLANGEKVSASIVLLDVVPVRSNACVSQRAVVGALAVASGDKSLTMLAYSDQDRPGTADREQILKILKTYRGVPAADRKTITPPPSTSR